MVDVFRNYIILYICEGKLNVLPFRKGYLHFCGFTKAVVVSNFLELHVLRVRGYGQDYSVQRGNLSKSLWT